MSDSKRSQDTEGERVKKGSMNRRSFMKTSAKCLALATIGVGVPGLRQSAWGEPGRPDIVISKGSPASATRKAVEALGGMARYVEKGGKVVVKPNMSFPNPPDRATTTHPEVVGELVKMCLEQGAASVLVLDNPLRKSELCIERSGLRKACEGLPGSSARGVTDARFFREVKVPQGHALTSTEIMEQVLEADTLIAVPVAKSHGSTGVSLAMKGMMGLVHNRSKFHFPLDLDTAIVDLCTILKPRLTVIDASRILSEGGPGGPGKVIVANMIIASEDLVAADAMAVETGTWYGRKISAQQVRHIKMAHDRGLGNLDVAGQAVEEVSAG